MAHKHLAVFSDLLKEHYQCGEDEASHLCSVSKVRKVKKYTHVLNEGEEDKYVFFVISGAMRMFYLNDDFKEFTVKFSFENQWLNKIAARVSDTESALNIQAMENSVVVQIDRDQFWAFAGTNIPFLSKFLEVIREEITRYRDRVISNIAEDSEVRFDQFAQYYSEYWNRIPDRHIASYIGVTPEFFSKLKKRKLREYLGLPKQ